MPRNLLPDLFPPVSALDVKSTWSAILSTVLVSLALRMSGFFGFLVRTMVLVSRSISRPWGSAWPESSLYKRDWE